MARKFLTPIDLNKLELQNASIQNLATDPSSPVTGQIYYNTSDTKLKVYNGASWSTVGNTQEEIEDYVDGLIAAGGGISVSYDDGGNTLTIANTGVTSLTGTSGEIDVSASAGAVTLSLPTTVSADISGNAATATSLETARTIAIVGDASASASFDGTGDISLSLTLDSESAVSSITGTANEIDVSASVGAVTISLPSTISADLDGTAASATYAVTAGTANSVAADSVTLGTDTTGNYVASISGTTNEIEVSGSGEGAAVTVGLPNDVTIAGDLTVSGDLTISGSATYVNTEIIELDDNTIVLNANATTASENAGIEVERGTVESNVSLLWNETSDTWTLTNDATNYHSITRKHSEDVGNNSDTVFAVDHNLGTRDVTVQVYDNSTYDTVEVDVVRTSTTRVTVTFASAPTSNEYRVVVVG